MTNDNLHIEAENGEAIDKIAEEQLLNITEFLDKSGQEINRRKRLKNAFIIAISSLCIIAIIAFIWAFTQRSEALKNKILIEISSKSNQIATKAYMSLDKDPTLAFRLAEQAYKIHPTPLAKQVIMAAYGEMPFYRKLEGHTESVRPVKFSPNGKLIVTGSLDNTVRLWDFNGNLAAIMEGHKSGNSNNNESVNFSPDGKYIVSASYDSTARLWDLQGNCLAIMKHDGPVSSACFSPLRPVSVNSLSFSGKGPSDTGSSKQYLILTASSDKTARLWNFNPSARPIGRNDRTGVIPNGSEGSSNLMLKPSKTLKGHTKGLRLAKFSPDGKYILTASGDKTARIWDLSGRQLHILKGHTKPLFDANFSSDGKNIVTAGWDGLAILWEITGKKIYTFDKHQDLILTASFSTDGEYVITGSSEKSSNKNLKIWKIDGKEITELIGHTATIWSATFSPGGKYIISASDDGTARLWDMNGTELMVLKGHTSQVLSANFSPDGKYVVTASGDGTARIWNIQPKENPVLKGHTAYVFDVNFSPDYQYIVTGGADYTARFWNKSGNLLQILSGHEHYGVTVAKFFNNSNKLITATSGNIRLWDLINNDTIRLTGHNGFIWQVEVNKDDKKIISLSSGITFIWNTEGKKLQEIENTEGSKFLGEGKYIATISTDSFLYFWKLKDKPDSIYYEQFKKIKLPPTKGTGQAGNAFTSVDFSKDNYWFLTTSEDSTARLWKFEDVKNLPEDSIKPLCEYKHPAITDQPLFSPNSKLFLTVGNDKIVRLFDLKCNVIAELKGHSDAINDINFSPDGKYIVTGSNDNTVRIWNLEGNELQLFPVHKAAVNKVQFSPDGSYILSASDDHTARLMPVSVEDVLHKINVEKVRGAVFQLSEDDKQVYGIVD